MGRPSIGDALRGFPRGLDPGQPGDLGLFQPDSIVRRVNAETVLLLGGGRALLMQLAHPMVAAGVADHSGFLTDPFGRLWNTLDLTLMVSFGDTEQSRTAAARINDTHRLVVGERDGRPYRALDPDLLLWVHATLVDSALVAYERFVGRVGMGVRGRYYEEMKRQAIALTAPPASMPATYEEFAEYVDRTVSSLEVSDEARALSRGVIAPSVAPALVPAIRALRFVTTGLLPGRLREGFGLRWSPARERVLDATAMAVRVGLVPLLPARIRRWPHARQAEARDRFTGRSSRPPP